MKRNKYKKEHINWLVENANKYTKKELIQQFKKFGYEVSKLQMGCLLAKRNLKAKDYQYSKKRNMDKIKIGTEYIKPDGMILVKISRNKWQYKQRKIWEEYYKEKLISNDFIIFKDGNRQNYNIDNLEKITRWESAYMRGESLFSKKKEITETGIMVARLKTKIMEVNNV